MFVIQAKGRTVTRYYRTDRGKGYSGNTWVASILDASHITLLEATELQTRFRRNHPGFRWRILTVPMFIGQNISVLH